MASVSLRAQQKENAIAVSLLFDHPMESGRRTDAQGIVIPPWYITTVAILLDDEPVESFELGSLVTKNPVLGLELDNNARGKKLKVLWQDNRGEQGQRTLALDKL